MTEEKKNELFDKYLEGVDLKHYPYQESIKFLLFNAWLRGLDIGEAEATKELRNQIEQMKCCRNCKNDDSEEWAELCEGCDNFSKWELAE